MNPDVLIDDQNLVEHNSEYYTINEFNKKINFDFNSIHDQSTLRPTNNISNQFSLFHMNARSLNKIFLPFEILMDSINNFPFSAIGITETWLHENSPEMFNLSNYEMIRKDRKNGRGGGVAIYINNTFIFKIRTDIEIEGSESLFIEVSMSKNKNMIIGTIYRPPTSDVDTFINQIDSVLNKISQENKHIYLMGDYNLDLVNKTNNNILKFYNTMLLYSCYPHISKPTRIDSVSETLIDNIFSNVIHAEHLNGILYSDISDHLPIFVICYNVISEKTRKNIFVKKRKETEQTIDSLIFDLSKEQWREIFSVEDANLSYQNFLHKLSFYIDKNMPFIKKKDNISIKQPWITQGLMQSILTRNRLYKISLRKPTAQNKDRYKHYRNRLTTLIRVSRKRYYSNKIESNQGNVKVLWQTINDLLKTKKKVCSDIIVENGNEITDPHSIATAFNNFFVNIGPRLASTIHTNENFKDYLSDANENSLFFIPVNENEILEIVRSFKMSRSCGYDGISVYLLKKIIYCLASPLVHICNLSLSTGIFPDSLKIAKVIPIYKKDDLTQIKNYRPISLLPVISKILEKIVYKRLYSFLQENNTLICNQFGFRKGFSTDYALIQSCDKITQTLNNKEHIIGVFMDLSKAFDTMNHNILLQKLTHYGIRGTALKWFNNYLVNRKQFVSFQSVNSPSLNVLCGVPQGSILGPLLFLIYINDIVKSSPLLTYVLFADDTNIFCSHKCLNTLIYTLNNELVKISTWFKCNKLSLNLDKTCFINFCASQTHFDQVINIVIDDISIVERKSTKFLGITLDSKLTWNNHVNNITTSISRAVGVIGKMRDLVPEKILYTLYNALVLPYFTYCNTVWGNCSITKINIIFLLQKRALRICTHSNYLAHTNPLFYRLNILKVSDLHLYQTAICMFKYTQNSLPLFHDVFIPNSHVHSYPTRNCTDFHLHNPKTLLAHKSIRYHGPDIWNALPRHIKQCTSLYSFKATLKKNIISQYNV